MTRIRLDLSYDGSPFHGWALQPGLPSVAGALQSALALVLRAPVQLTVAGRTDAGVHAIGQVAHFDWPPLPLSRPAVANTGEDLDNGGETVSVAADCASPVEAPLGAFSGLERGDSGYFLQRLHSALQVVLSGNQPQVPHLDLGEKPNYPAAALGSIYVHRAQVVPAQFDARFSALGRHYQYRIADGAARRDPRCRLMTWWHPAGELDLEKMREGARFLLGEHDFASFAKPREGATTIRTLTELELCRNTRGEVLVEVGADAFCHSMVRLIVGALTEVGRGKREPQWIAQALESRRRLPQIPLAPAGGLTLVRVDYPQMTPAVLLQRQQQTRARRG